MVFPSIHHTQDGSRKPKTEDKSMEESIFHQLFKEENDIGSVSKLSKEVAVAVLPSQNSVTPLPSQTSVAPLLSQNNVAALPSQNSHAHPYKPEPGWVEQNYLSKIEGYSFPSAASFLGNGYMGGPNITPPYHKISGELLDSNKSDSSSTSGTDSSPTHSHNGPNEQSYQVRDCPKESNASFRLGKDEKIAREAGIRFNVKDIVNPPMDEFNDMLSKEDLTEEQLNICRDIRRRGKNKVAAQNCRKRKLEQIEELQDRLQEAKRRQYQLQNNHEKLLTTYSAEACKLTRLTDLVLAHHEKSPHSHVVQVEGEEVKILPKSEVALSDRIPKPVSSFMHSYMHGQYSGPDRSLYSSTAMEHSAGRGWD